MYFTSLHFRGYHYRATEHTNLSSNPIPLLAIAQIARMTLNVLSQICLLYSYQRQNQDAAHVRRDVRARGRGVGVSGGRGGPGDTQLRRGNSIAIRRNPRKHTRSLVGVVHT